MKIALLFGSFDPIHNGHTGLARYTIENNIAEQVWFIVSPHNPLKEAGQLSSFEHRIAMTKIAVSKLINVKVLDIENQLSKPSYTINTIELLKSQHPNDDFFILCGSDVYALLDKWYRIDDLKTLIEFKVYPRGTVYAYCNKQYKNANIMDVSSTEIRIDYDNNQYLDTEVLGYIINHNLYNYMQSMTIYELTQAIEEDPTAQLYYERGKLHYSKNDFGKAINDFNQALELEANHTPSREMLSLTNSIIDFRNFDIYNP